MPPRTTPRPRETQSGSQHDHSRNEATATNEAVPSTATPDNEVTAEAKKDTSDTTGNTASDAGNSNTDNFSDYYRFKFGHFGGHYGENADTTSPADMPAGDATTNNEQ